MELDPSHPDCGPNNEMRYRKYQYSKPTPDIVLKNLELLDLENLRTINLKGGEPFLNSEIEAALDYLDKKNILSNLIITVSTNGTIYNEKILTYLRKASLVNLHVSIDGLGELNKYIRFGNSHTDLISENIAKFSEMKNIKIGRATSTMVYNIINLIQLRDWWIEFAKRNDRISLSHSSFNNFVTHPQWLNPCVLSDKFRKSIVLALEKNQIHGEFKFVINLLKSEYLGDELHNRWVSYTRSMESIRKNSILDIVPELKEEMVHLS